MKQLFRNKKAVSPVIGTVLMIMIVMIGMTVLFAFVSTYSDAYKAGAGSSVMESLTIEDIWLNPDGTDSHIVYLTIYNSGKIDSTIASVYVNGSALTIDDDINLSAETPKDIPFGQHLTLNLKWDQDFSLAQTYLFRITTLRSSNFEATHSP
jgi:flagellin-like protein